MFPVSSVIQPWLLRLCCQKYLRPFFDQLRVRCLREFTGEDNPIHYIKSVPQLQKVFTKITASSWKLPAPER
jgi:hypothetical protein